MKNDCIITCDMIELSYNAFRTIDYYKFLEITQLDDNYGGGRKWSEFSGHYYVYVLSCNYEIRERFDNYLSEYIKEHE